MEGKVAEERWRLQVEWFTSDWHFWGGKERERESLDDTEREREREREMGVQGREREHEKKLLSSILRRGTVLSVPLDFKVGMNGWFSLKT